MQRQRSRECEHQPQQQAYKVSIKLKSINSRDRYDSVVLCAFEKKHSKLRVSFWRTVPLRLTWDDGRRVLCFKPTTWRWLCVSSWWTARFSSVRFSSVRHKRYNHSKWITIRFIISNYLCDWQRIRIDLNFSWVSLWILILWFLSFEYSAIFSNWCLNNWQLHAYSYDFRQLNFALYWNYIKQMSKSRVRISFCWAIHSRCLSLGIITWNRNCLFYRAAIQNVALMLMNEFICCCCCCCNIIAAVFFRWLFAVHHSISV